MRRQRINGGPIVHGAAEPAAPSFGALVHAARYDRFARANTIAWSYARNALNLVAAPIAPGVGWRVPFDVEEIKGDLYRVSDGYFCPQVAGRYDVDIWLESVISPAAADIITPSWIKLYFETKDDAGTLIRKHIGSAWSQRVTVGGVTYDTFLRAWSIPAALTVDHEIGREYSLVWEHNGTGNIAFIERIRAYMSFHYYDSKTIAYPEG